MAVKKVTMFQTSNGKTFQKERDAINHEAKIEIINSLKKLNSTYYELDINDLNDTLLNQLFEIGTKAYKILDSKK